MIAIRTRRPEDLPTLAGLLLEQQPTSRYPRRDPLPVPAEDFIARSTDETAWVAQVEGELAGHVAVSTLREDEIGQAFGYLTGMPLPRLGCVSTLFVGLGHAGRGVGSRLLATATRALVDQGRVPVLDVFADHGGAHELYVRRGWVQVGAVRPDWVPQDASDLLLMMLPPSGHTS